ncbi:uncharacterized protein METZ01_LOCUS194875, partial [marine metagenome]
VDLFLVVDHLDRHASHPKHLGIGQTLVPQRIEACNRDGGWSEPGVVCSTDWCRQRFGSQILISGEGLGEPPHGGQLEEVALGVLLPRRPPARVVVGVCGRVDQELVGDRRG